MQQQVFIVINISIIWGQNRNIWVLPQWQVNSTPPPIFGIYPGKKLRFIHFSPGASIVNLRYLNLHPFMVIVFLMVNIYGNYLIISCAICYCALSAQDSRITECGHVFHVSCLKKIDQLSGYMSNVSSKMLFTRHYSNNI